MRKGNKEEKNKAWKGEKKNMCIDGNTKKKGKTVNVKEEEKKKMRKNLNSRKIQEKERRK